MGPWRRRRRWPARRRRRASTRPTTQYDAQRRLERERTLAAAEQLEAQQTAADPALHTVDAFERSMWRAFRQPDTSEHTAKLAWISPLRTLFIFSTGARREAFSLSLEQLAEAVRRQRVRLVGQDGVVARVLVEAMGQGAVNDPAGSAVA